MAYAVLADVQGLIAQITIAAGSIPNTTQANAIIADTSDEVDAHLAARGVATPVAAPASFVRALALLNSYGAAAAILKSALPDATGPGDTPAYAFWEERYRAGLKAIDDGTIIPDSVAAAAGSGLVRPSTYLTRNPDQEEHLGDIAEPMFKVGKRF